MGRGKLTVRFADVDLAARVTEAIERERPEGNHPFHIEVAGTPDGQVVVRVWKSPGRFRLHGLGSNRIGRASQGPHGYGGHRYYKTSTRVCGGNG